MFSLLLYMNIKWDFEEQIIRQLSHVPLPAFLSPDSRSETSEHRMNQSKCISRLSSLKNQSQENTFFR